MSYSGSQPRGCLSPRAYGDTTRQLAEGMSYSQSFQVPKLSFRARKKKSISREVPEHELSRQEQTNRVSQGWQKGHMLMRHVEYLEEELLSKQKLLKSQEDIVDRMKQELDSLLFKYDKCEGQKQSALDQLSRAELQLAELKQQGHRYAAELQRLKSQHTMQLHQLKRDFGQAKAEKERLSVVVRELKQSQQSSRQDLQQRIKESLLIHRQAHETKQTLFSLRNQLSQATQKLARAKEMNAKLQYQVQRQKQKALTSEERSDSLYKQNRALAKQVKELKEDLSFLKEARKQLESGERIRLSQQVRQSRARQKELEQSLAKFVSRQFQHKLSLAQKEGELKRKERELQLLELQRRQKAKEIEALRQQAAKLTNSIGQREQSMHKRQLQCNKLQTLSQGLQQQLLFSKIEKEEQVKLLAQSRERVLQLERRLRGVEQECSQALQQQMMRNEMLRRERDQLSNSIHSSQILLEESQILTKIDPRKASIQIDSICSLEQSQPTQVSGVSDSLKRKVQELEEQLAAKSSTVVELQAAQIRAFQFDSRNKFLLQQLNEKESKLKQSQQLVKQVGGQLSVAQEQLGVLRQKLFKFQLQQQILKQNTQRQKQRYRNQCQQIQRLGDRLASAQQRMKTTAGDYSRASKRADQAERQNKQLKKKFQQLKSNAEMNERGLQGKIEQIEGELRKLVSDRDQFQDRVDGLMSANKQLADNLEYNQKLIAEFRDNQAKLIQKIQQLKLELRSQQQSTNELEGQAYKWREQAVAKDKQLNQHRESLMQLKARLNQESQRACQAVGQIVRLQNAYAQLQKQLVDQCRSKQQLEEEVGLLEAEREGLFQSGINRDEQYEDEVSRHKELRKEIKKSIRALKMVLSGQVQANWQEVIEVVSELERSVGAVFRTVQKLRGESQLNHSKRQQCEESLMAQNEHIQQLEQKLQLLSQQLESLKFTSRQQPGSDSAELNPYDQLVRVSRAILTNPLDLAERRALSTSVRSAAEVYESHLAEAEQKFSVLVQEYQRIKQSESRQFKKQLVKLKESSISMPLVTQHRTSLTAHKDSSQQQGQAQVGGNLETEPDFEQLNKEVLQKLCVSVDRSQSQDVESSYELFEDAPLHSIQ